MAKRFTISTQNGYIANGLTKAEAQKELAEIVREAAQSCRRTYKRCSVVGSVRSGSVEIKVGGRQGYNMWQRYIIGEDCS